MRGEWFVDGGYAGHAITRIEAPIQNGKEVSNPMHRRNPESRDGLI
ncbi:hypothetical protein HNR46_001526 [Haloferula luteola]|uniref:Uncharacterized protein n=1 Tax=Haloferula luteola TaxID=595692 RepID=A0A840VBI0_9BACT|nr:hypothetical protein [Haloferula luteola]